MNVTDGVLTVVAGERRLENPQVAVVSQNSGIPASLAMDNSTAGGAALNAHTPGITPPSWLSMLGKGTYNKGLLVTTWGRARAVGTDSFHINDGTNTAETSGDGWDLRVQTNGQTSLPSVGQYVVVTGVSSSFQWTSDGNTYTLPMIRVRDNADWSPAAGEAIYSGMVVGQGGGLRWSLIGLPAVPYWSDTVRPYTSYVFVDTERVLDGHVFTGNVIRWDTTPAQIFDDSYIMYTDEANADLLFGAIYSGEGYWLETWRDGPVNYIAVVGPIAARDRYIKLPYAASEGGGLTLIGYPFLVGQSFSNVRITDGYRVLIPADAIAANWIEELGYWWDQPTQTRKSVGLAGADTTSLSPWTGYWIRSFKSHLALIIPSPDSSAPSTPVVTDDGDYTNSTTTLRASWSSEDLETGIAEYMYAIGTSAGLDDVIGWTSAGTDTEVTRSDLRLHTGTTYYFSVKAKNQAGLWSAEGSSDGITVDTVIPNPGTADSPPYATSTPVIVTYDGAGDPFGELERVELWYKKGINGPWTNSEQSSSSGSGQFNFSPPDGPGTYYFDLVAEDKAGNRSPAASGEGDDSTVFTAGLDPCSFSAIIIPPGL